MPENPRINLKPTRSPLLDQSLREQDERAGERNKYRTLAQKLFGQEKVSGVDMAMEEAMKMNSLIDQEVEKGTKMDEAVKTVSTLPEFKLKGLRNIKKEEYVRAKTLQFAHALEENKFLKAKVLRKLPQTEVDDATVEIYQNAVTSAINQRAGDLVNQKDGENFRKVIRGFGNDIQRERIQVTDEALKTPEIQGPIQKDLVGSFKWHNTISPESFAKERDRLVKMGIVDSTEINQLPEIQQVAKDRLVESFKWHNTIDPNSFAKERDSFVALGVADKAEINGLAEIQKAAKEYLIASYNWHNTISPEGFTKDRDAFVSLGIVKEETVNRWIKEENSTSSIPATP